MPPVLQKTIREIYKRLRALETREYVVTAGDPDAIHDNVAGEIAAIAPKVVPIAADLVIIEDSAAANVKKSVQIGNLPGGIDPNAIHDNVAAEIAAIAPKVAPINADLLVIEDSAAANAKKSIQIGNIPFPADPNAIHDNVAGEIILVAEKVAPINADVLLIEDTAAGNVKKRVQMVNLPGGADPNAIHVNVAAEIAGIAAKAVPIAADLLVIEDSAAANAKKSIQIGNLPVAGSTVQIVTVQAAAADAHVGNNVWEDINAMSVAITLGDIGILLCHFTCEIYGTSANWEHYDLRFDLDGITQSEEYAKQRDSNPIDNEHYMHHIHTVFTAVAAGIHTVKAQWRSTSNLDCTIVERRLTVLGLE